MFRYLLIALLMVSVSAGSAPAVAQDSASEDYDAVIARGVREFKHGYWAEALAAFRKAHELQPSARTLRGMGLSLFEMRRYAEAADVMAQALETKGDTGGLTEEQRTSLEQARQEALSYTATLEVEPSPDDAALWLDGERLHQRKRRVDQGEHVLRAEYDGKNTELHVKVDMGEARFVTIEVRNASMQPEAVARAANDSTVRQPSGGLPPVAVVGLVAGGAGFATFGVFGVLALSEAGCRPDCTDRENNRVTTYSAVADVGLVVGLLGAGTFGLAMLLDDDGPREAPRPQATVLPWLRRDGIVGLQAHGTL